MTRWVWTSRSKLTYLYTITRGYNSRSSSSIYIINYISNYGREEGGYVELKKGIDYNETQLNFRYGGAINDGLNFHVGGFFKKGN